MGIVCIVQWPIKSTTMLTCTHTSGRRAVIIWTKIDLFSGFSSQILTIFLSEKRRDGIWGGHLDLVAISEMYNRQVVIMEVDQDAMNVSHRSEPGNHQNLPIILLSFHRRSHYNSVRSPSVVYPLGDGKGEMRVIREARIAEEQIGDKKPTSERMLRPTVHAAGNFNAAVDAKELRRAMKGLGTDEKALIDIIGYRTLIQRLAIVQEFPKVTRNHDLMTDLASEMSVCG
eukprot:10234_1